MTELHFNRGELPDGGKLRISKADIKKADPKLSGRCAAALALRRKWGAKQVQVFPRHQVTGRQLTVARFTLPNGQHYEVDSIDDLMVFASTYDNFKERTPAFEVDFKKAKLVRRAPKRENDRPRRTQDGTATKRNPKTRKAKRPEEKARNLTELAVEAQGRRQEDEEEE